MDDDIRRTLIRLIEEKKPENVEQLKVYAGKELSLSEQEITRNILQLQNERKIAIAESGFATESFRSFLASEPTRWYWIIIVFAATTSLIVFAAPESIYPLAYIRWAFGAIFLLFLPGYCFARALFPKESQKENSSASNTYSVSRLILSIPLSMALAPLIALLLNYTPWGVRLVPIVLGLLAMTGIFGTIAVLREYQIRIKNPRMTTVRVLGDLA